MPRSPLRLLFAAASAAALAACGSSESTSSTTGTGGSESTSTSTATSTGTSTGTGAIKDACTNAADAAVLMAKDVKGIAVSCGQLDADDEPTTFTCIKMGTGLSDACTSCYDDSVVCETDHCSTMCDSDPKSQDCIECREMYCVPAFQTCSGLDKG